MARIETDPNYTAPTFSRATAATDPFKKEDVQNLAAAVSTHDHSTGKGAPLVAGSIPAGSITGAMITDLTVDTADLKDGAVTSAKIADGTIATADLANAAVTNVKLGSDTARANLLTNGGFEIWQRGNGAFTANGAWTADRWSIGLAGTDTLSVNWNSASSDARSNACAACVFTLGTGAGGTVLSQKLGASDGGAQLKNGQLTFSVRVNVAVANAVRLGIYDGSAWTYSAFHPGSGGYQTLSITANMTNTSSDRWVGVYFAASCTAYVDNAMLVVGSVPADYAPLHPADDLARCLRYYEIVGSGSDVIISGIATAGSQGVYQPFTYRAVKAVVPTVTLSTWSNSNCATPTINAGTIYLFRITTTSSAAGPFFSQTTGLVTSEANP